MFRLAEQRAEILQIEERREATRLRNRARRLLALTILRVGGSQHGVDERIGVIARDRTLERADGVGAPPRQEIAGSETEQVFAGKLRVEFDRDLQRPDRAIDVARPKERIAQSR